MVFASTVQLDGIAHELVLMQNEVGCFAIHFYLVGRWYSIGMGFNGYSGSNGDTLLPIDIQEA